MKPKILSGGVWAPLRHRSRPWRPYHCHVETLWYPISCSSVNSDWQSLRTSSASELWCIQKWPLLNAVWFVVSSLTLFPWWLQSVPRVPPQELDHFCHLSETRLSVSGLRDPRRDVFDRCFLFDRVGTAELDYWFTDVHLYFSRPLIFIYLFIYLTGCHLKRTQFFRK